MHYPLLMKVFQTQQATTRNVEKCMFTAEIPIVCDIYERIKSTGLRYKLVS